MSQPKIVSQKEWEAALAALRVKEKQATHARDALAAERRRLPRVRIEKEYELLGPRGRTSLAGLSEGRRQLVLYHFMFGPNRTEGCPGCSMVADQICHLAHLHARDTSFAMVSRAPLDRIEVYRRRMRWEIPWYSSFGSDFNADFGVGPVSPREDQDQDGETFGMSAFLREGRDVFHTYFTDGRGVETLGPVWTLLDLTPFGRQEDWEDSPEGSPKTGRYTWWRRHDEYADDGSPGSAATR